MAQGVRFSNVDRDSKQICSALLGFGGIQPLATEWIEISPLCRQFLTAHL